MFVALAGCGESGSSTYPVAGKVNYQEKPLPLGTVMFVSDNGPPAVATIGADGTYQLEAVPGKHRVSVVAMPPQQGRPDATVEGGIDTTGFPVAKSLIPQKYNEYRTSGIEVEVKPIGENQIDINLP
ncbi:MAG: hypothetical protein HY000_07210 [Planctomycetes bacterium]|nr:hypothetical protein [Planctomycetota bacterium]